MCTAMCNVTVENSAVISMNAEAGGAAVIELFDFPMSGLVPERGKNDSPLYSTVVQTTE